MSYAATVLARTDSEWIGEDVDLDEVEDLDGVVELVQQVVGDAANPALLFVEEDDEWFAVLRLDPDGEPRVFVSDARVISTSERAALFAEAAVDADLDDDIAAEDEDSLDAVDEDDDEAAAAQLDGEPAGDPGLLTDLGTPASRLMQLCAAEGQLPGDVISALCEGAGCLDVLEKLRGV